ncbi:hypothetical protein [Actinomadura sp. 9N407]|uniref:hypothetical protein n=1 Tax=Actinomadura sp. 9N407 TaxID=3375154 RepID=UPI0037BC4920
MARIPFHVAALLPVFLLMACRGAESAAPEPATTTPARTPATSAAPVPSPSPSQAPPAVGTAADKRDLDACRDAECEVVVKKGDRLRFDGEREPLRILSAGETFTATSPSGFTASVTGGGTVQSGSVHIEVGDSEGGRTAIRISPLD